MQAGNSTRYCDFIQLIPCHNSLSLSLFLCLSKSHPTISHLPPHRPPPKANTILLANCLNPSTGWINRLSHIKTINNNVIPSFVNPITFIQSIQIKINTVQSNSIQSEKKQLNLIKKFIVLYEKKKKKIDNW